MNKVDSLVIDLYKTVRGLEEAHRAKNINAIYGRSNVILRIINDLRLCDDPSVEGVIEEALASSDVQPGTPDLYSNICWKCHRTSGLIVELRASSHKRCDYCGWLICEICDACKSPDHGNCVRNVIKRLEKREIQQQTEQVAPDR
jgi:hypothetical protein